MLNQITLFKLLDKKCNTCDKDNDTVSMIITNHNYYVRSC